MARKTVRGLWAALLAVAGGCASLEVPAMRPDHPANPQAPAAPAAALSDVLETDESDLPRTPPELGGGRPMSGMPHEARGGKGARHE